MSVGWSGTISFMTLLTIVEQSQRLVTLETCDQSDDLTSDFGKFSDFRKFSDFQKNVQIFGNFQIFKKISDFQKKFRFSKKISDLQEILRFSDIRKIFRFLEN